MRAKLLRKIRKEWAILKVEELPTYPGEILESAASNLKLPFYILTAPKGKIPQGSARAFKSFWTARENMLRHVHNYYAPTVKYTDGVFSKVWHV